MSAGWPTHRLYNSHLSAQRVPCTHFAQYSHGIDFHMIDASMRLGYYLQWQKVQMNFESEVEMSSTSFSSVIVHSVHNRIE